MVILCDFDDTTTEQNIATLLLERFGRNGSCSETDGGWRALRQQVVDRRMPLWKYQETAFSRLGESRQELAAFAGAHARLRSGFVELAAHCAEHGVGMAVVSHGLDFYVEAVLEEHGLLHLPHYTVGTAVADGRIAYSYSFTRPGCERWGNCKCRVVEGYQALGHEVVYVGDGISDTCPASKADFVFALGRLLQYCRDESIAHREFNDFHDVIAYLNEQPLEATRTTPPLERLTFD